jgi:hypothetical protein
VTNVMSSGLTGVFSLGRGFRSASCQAQQLVQCTTLATHVYCTLAPDSCVLYAVDEV